MHFILLSVILGQVSGTYYEFNPAQQSASAIVGPSASLTANVCEPQATTDTLPITRSICSQGAYQNATGANRVGASRIICGGIGTKLLNTFLTGTGADTYTVTYVTTAGVTATVVFTAGVSFVCGPTQADCATNFKNAINASALAANGVTAVCDDATCSTLAVYLLFDQCLICAFSHVIADVGGAGVFAVAVSGNAGTLQTPSLTNLTGGFCFANDTDTCITRYTANAMAFMLNGGIIAALTTSGLSVGNSVFTASGGITSAVNRIPIGTTCALGGAGDACVGQALYVASETYAQVEADINAGACTPKRMVIDTGGADREFCRCNSAGTAYDCCTINIAPTCSTNGPVD